MALPSDNSTKELIQNLDKLHTTELGAYRIRKNLSLQERETEDVVEWCRLQITLSGSQITREGKNWYIQTAGGCRITVNAHSYTVITAHRQRKS